MLNLGFFNTSSTRTRVRFSFPTFAAAGGNVAPLSAFEAADLRIYRAADGAALSATQRSSSSGITMTSPFDSLVGLHGVDIDLTDNTDAGFYASGYYYEVHLAPDTETIDGQTITSVPLACFEIGVQPVNVTQFGGTAGTFASGVPAVNATQINSQSEAAVRLQRACHAITKGTVGSASTTTSVVTSSLDPTDSVTDQFKGLIMAFDKDTTSVGLRGQKTDILGSSTGGVFTVTALTTAPQSGDTFTIS